MDKTRNNKMSLRFRVEMNTCSSITWRKKQADLCELETSLVYIASSGLAKGTEKGEGEKGTFTTLYTPSNFLFHI